MSNKKWKTIRIVCGILSAFPFLLALIAGTGLLQGIPHTFTKDVWFGGLCSLVPTTVVAGATFYMTISMQEQEERHRDELEKQEQRYREHLERPRFVGAGFQLQLVLEKYPDVQFQQEQKYKYLECGWGKELDRLKNSIWIQISGRNLNYYNMRILNDIEVSSVVLYAEGRKLKLDTFFTRIEYYPGENTDFRISIACVLDEQNLEKLDGLLKCYTRTIEPLSSSVCCQFTVTDDGGGDGYSVDYLASLKNLNRKDGITAFGTQRQLFTVKTNGNEP